MITQPDRHKTAHPHSSIRKRYLRPTAPASPESATPGICPSATDSSFKSSVMGHRSGIYPTPLRLFKSGLGSRTGLQRPIVRAKTSATSITVPMHSATQILIDLALTLAGSGIVILLAL
jgi:hypothetical protein